MKKFLAVLLAGIMMFSFCACGEEKNKDGSGDLYGRWEISYVEYEGGKFTTQEWKNMEDEDLSGIYLIIREDGKFYFYEDDYGDLGSWLASENSIMIGDEKCEIVDDTIRMEYWYGDYIYFEKVTDDQTIPSEPSEDGDTEEEEETSSIIEISSEIEESADIEYDWEEFIADYEAWADDYIEFMAKYKANPSDLSLIAEYAEMMSDMSEWSEKAGDIENDLSAAEAAKYSAELARIVAKLAQAAY